MATDREFSGPFSPTGRDGTATLSAYHRQLTRRHEATDPFGSGVVVAVDVIIPAGAQEEPHTHLNPSFMFVDTPAPVAVSLVDSNGTAKEVFRSKDRPFDDGSTTSLDTAADLPKWARAASAIPECQKMEPEPLHFVTNLNPKGATALRATRVEFVGTPLPENHPVVLGHDTQEVLAAAMELMKPVGLDVALVGRWDLEDAVATAYRLDYGRDEGGCVHDAHVNDDDHHRPHFSEMHAHIAVPSNGCVVVIEGSLHTADVAEGYGIAVRRAGTDVELQPLVRTVGDDDPEWPRPRVWAIGGDHSAVQLIVRKPQSEHKVIVAFFVVTYTPRSLS